MKSLFWIALGAALYTLWQKFRQPKEDLKLKILMEAKEKELAATQVLKQEQTTLKQEVTNEQANKTEQQKQDYWRDYVKKNSNKPTDNQ